MAELSPIGKLDFVFETLRDNKNEYATLQNIHKLVNPDNMYSELIPYAELKRILKKLVDDKYAYEIFNMDDIEYVISFEGHLFHGYKEQVRQQRLQLTTDAQNEKRIVRNERLLVNGTWFAGIAASALLAWDVVKFLIEHSCQK